MAKKYKPEGYHAVTPYLVVDGAEQLVDFVKRAFGATENFRMDGPDGRIAHAEVQVGDSVVMVGNASEEMNNPAMPAVLYLYVEDADATYQSAIGAGGTSIEEPSDQFYGDRRGAVRDPLGNHWFIATQVEEISPEEMAKRVEALSQQS